MSFLDITVIPVPTANKAAYLEHSRQTTPFFKEHGAISVNKCWGEDVPDGKLTDFKKAVDLKDDETSPWAGSHGPIALTATPPGPS